MNEVPYIVGDVHLGRKFTNGVPLHRKGDREKMVHADFEERIGSYEGPMLVQTGDLFDSFTVDEAIVLWAESVVRRAALAYPGTKYVFYRGNHDASKDVNKKSSFDVFEALLRDLPNVLVLKDVTIVPLHYIADNEHDPVTKYFGFIPWHPFKSAQVLAEELVQMSYHTDASAHQTLEAVFGHWDVKDYGSTAHDFNMVPTKILIQVTKTIYTGHVHKPCEFDRDGVRVHVVGSMQPYAHGEGDGFPHYMTIPYDTYVNEKDDKYSHHYYTNANVRILVKDGENPEPPDCLSFSTKKVTETGEEDEEGEIDVEMADFNMDTLFATVLKECEVSESVAERVLGKFKELRNVGN